MNFEKITGLVFRPVRPLLPVYKVSTTPRPVQVARTDTTAPANPSANATTKAPEAPDTASAASEPASESVVSAYMSFRGGPPTAPAGLTNGSTAPAEGGAAPPAEDPTTAEGMARRPGMSARTAEQQKEAAEAAANLKTGTPAQKTQALLTLNKYLPAAEVDKLSAELGVDKDKTVQSLRKDAKATESMKTLGSPDSTPAQRAEAALTLAGRLVALGLVPGKVGQTLAPILKDLETGSAALRNVQKVIEACDVLSDPAASAVDKASAALDLATNLGEMAPEKLKEALSPFLDKLPAGQKLVDAIATWSDPKASAVDKAKSSLALASALKDALGEDFPALGQKLRYADSSLRSVGNALTLLDPKASLEDKAIAALELTADAPQLAGDLKALTKFLGEHGVSAAEADRIEQQIRQLPPERLLSPDLQKQLDPAVARGLTTEQAERLRKLESGFAGDENAQKVLGKALAGLRNGQSVDELLKAAEGVADRGARAGLLKALGDMKPGMADELLSQTIGGKPAAQALAEVFGKLDPKGAAKLAEILGDADSRTLHFALDLAGKIDGKVLQDALDVIGDAGRARAFIGALATVLDKTGLKLSTQLAGKILKGLAKAVPVAGAFVAGKDAYDMARIAADTRYPPDIRYMAMQAAKLNGVDVALSVAEPFIAEFGVPIAADLALAVGETAMDIIVSSQIEQFEAQGSNYVAPDWLKAGNVALAAASGPQGAIELATVYGPEGAEKLVGSVARTGGKAAAQAAQVSGELAAQGLGEGLHLTASGMHGLADIIRHPEKYGAAAELMVKNAVDRLGALARGAGELAEAAGRELTKVVGELKDLGLKGLERLGWIASHPVEAGKAALNALRDTAAAAIAQGTEAGRALWQASLQAIGNAKTSLIALGKAGKEALQTAEAAITGVVDSAIAAGQKGLEALSWLASHPGEAATIAAKALTDLVAKGGELAEAAGEKLRQLLAKGGEVAVQAWQQIQSLGKAGAALLDGAMDAIRSAGAQGVELLKYVVQNPGAAASDVRQAALNGLKAIAQGTGDAARAAVDAVVGFVDTGIAEARTTATELLADGREAADHIIAAFARNLSEGGKEVIDGLADLGDAGHEALSKLSNAGVAQARKWYEAAKGEGVPFVPFI